MGSPTVESTPRDGKGRRGKGRGPRRFAFTYQHIADACGLRPQTVRRAVSDGHLDPSNLASLVRYVAARLPTGT